MSPDANELLPVALSIAGFDPSVGAGVIADVQAFTALGCFPTAAITSVTFQNTSVMSGAEHQSAATVRRQVIAIVKGGHLGDVLGPQASGPLRSSKSDVVSQGHEEVDETPTVPVAAIDLLDNEGQVTVFQGEWIEAGHFTAPAAHCRPQLQRAWE